MVPLVGWKRGKMPEQATDNPRDSWKPIDLTDYVLSRSDLKALDDRRIPATTDTGPAESCRPRQRPRHPAQRLMTSASKTTMEARTTGAESDADGLSRAAAYEETTTRMKCPRADHPPGARFRSRAMDAALDYLAACTRDDIDWVELLRMRAAGADTTDIDEWMRQQRNTGDGEPGHHCDEQL